MRPHPVQTVYDSFTHPLLVPFATESAPLFLKVVHLAFGSAAMEGGIVLPAITRPVAGITILAERRKDSFIVVQLATPNLLNDPIQCSTMPSKVVTLK